MSGLLFMFALGCVGEKQPPETAADKLAPPPVPAGGTIVQIAPRSEAKLSGTARFEPTDDGLRVVVTLVDAPPGEHAVHIHEFGDCSAPDAKSAGEHYNPKGHQHGRPPDERHIGDLGNMIVTESGNGSLEIVVPGVTLDAEARDSFSGRSIVVHAKADDGSQPSGNAGARIGCAVIET